MFIWAIYLIIPFFYVLEALLKSTTPCLCVHLLISENVFLALSRVIRRSFYCYCYRNMSVYVVFVCLPYMVNRGGVHLRRGIGGLFS